jgi:hypothetical protein
MLLTLLKGSAQLEQSALRLLNVIEQATSGVKHLFHRAVRGVKLDMRGNNDRFHGDSPFFKRSEEQHRIVLSAESFIIIYKI